MADCNYNCPEDQLPHEQVECDDFQAGGISSLGLLKCGQTTITDFTNATQYESAISNGDLVLIEDIVGQIPEASPVEGSSTSSCGPETRTNTWDRELTWMDYNFTDGNQQLADQMNKRKYNLIAYNCGSDKVHVIEAKVQFQVRGVVPEREGELDHFVGRAYWRSFNGPVIYDAPAGIFNQNSI